MGRRPLPKHITALVCKTLTSQTTCGISNPFGLLFHTSGQVTYVLLTRPPLKYPRRGLFVRLACVRHAASVHPEPGSNSPSSKEQSEDCKGLTFEPEHRILPITFQLLRCCRVELAERLLDHRPDCSPRSSRLPKCRRFPCQALFRRKYRCPIPHRLVRLQDPVGPRL